MFAGRDQTVSKNSPDNYIERDIRWVAVYKTLITKMNAHLTVQWCKKSLGTGLQRCGYIQMNYFHCVLDK